MGIKYYTIFAIPQGKGPIKKFRISTPLVLFISILLISSLLSICYLSYTYVETRDKLLKLAGLEQTTLLQETQLNFLASKVCDFEKKMVDLVQFDKKIRIMTNLDNKRSGSQLLGIGGPGPGEGKAISRAAEIESDLIDRIHENMDQLLDESALQKDSFTELLDFLEKQKSILAKNSYSSRSSLFTGKRESHKGIDIATEIGSEIVAPADGVVVRVDKEKAIGNLVKINHGNGMVTIYGHLLKKSDVKKGQKVKRGDVIGYVGNSGRSTGPHLHYSVCVNGVYVNPRRYLF